MTVRVKLCAALLPATLVAVNVREYIPAVPAAGVPESTPLVVLKVTPPGSTPLSMKVGAGDPVAVTVNVPATPTTKAALFALVIVGA